MLCSLCQTANAAQSQRCRACGAPLQTRASDAATPPDALPDGTLLIGAYAVESVLGQGGFGITYRCHDQMLDRRVAVKEFFPSGCRRHNAEVVAARGLSEADFREARAQFLAEARVLARCHHVGIVGVHAAFEANSTAYMVMELLHGKTLAQLLSGRRGCMEQAEAVAIIERVGEALSFVHGQNLLHRDIKPDNIIVCDDGRVMLIDFGTARETVVNQVQNQTVVVTPGYAPLEQYARQARRGAFTDVYSLAATLYHLLSGQMPPAASDRAMGVQLRPLRELNPQIGASVAHATECALQMEIAKRPQSVREFLDLLHAPVEAAEVEPFFSPQIADLPLDDDDEEWGDDEIPAPLAPDFLRAQQQSVRNYGAIGKAQPVNIAPPRAFSVTPTPPVSPTASPVSSGNSSGGVGVQNSSNSASASIYGWWMLGIFGFIGLLLMLNVGGQQRAATSPGNSSTGIHSPVVSGADRGEPKRKQDPIERALDKMPVMISASNYSLPGQGQPQTQEFYERRDGVSFSPDGQRLAYIDAQSVLRVLKLPDRQVLRSLTLDQRYVSREALFSLDNKTVAVTQDSDKNRSDKDRKINQVSVWSIQNGKRLGKFTTASSQDSVWPQNVISDEKILLRVTSDASKKTELLFWNPKTGKKTLAPFVDFADANWYSSVISPDAKELAIGDSQGRVRWLSFPGEKPKAQYATKYTLREYREQFQKNYGWGDSQQDKLDDPLGIAGLTYSANGQYLASFAWGEINAFDSQFQKIGSLRMASHPTNAAIAPDGKWMAVHGGLPNGTGNSPPANVLWNIVTGQQIQLPVPSEDFRGFSFSPDGKQLYGVFVENETFKLSTWRLDASPDATFVKPTLAAYQPAATSMGFSDFLAQTGQLSASLKGSSIEVRRANGDFVSTLNVGPRNVVTAKFSADDQFLAVRRYDGIIEIWDVNASKIVHRLEDTKLTSKAEEALLLSNTTSFDMTFSPDRKRFACARTKNGSSVIELWSLEGKPRRLNSFTLKPRIKALTFSSDGKSVIFGDEKGLVQRLDMAKFQKQILVSSNDPVLDVVSIAEKLIVVGDSKTTYYELLAGAKSTARQISQIEAPLRRSGSMARWAISADGQWMAVTSPSADIEVWRLPTGSFVQTLRRGSDENGDVPVFGPDYLRLIFSADGTRLTGVQRPFAAPLSSVTWQLSK